MNETSIKKYELGSEIGEGAYAYVLHGIERSTGESVAVKVLSKQKQNRSKKMEVAQLEKEALSRIRHPNVISYIGFAQDPMNQYIICEYAQNGTLSKVIEHISSTEQKKHIFGQLLLGIAAIHQQGFIHRDIKPENIMFDAKYRVKIIDFGSSKSFDIETKTYEEGGFVGSIDYVSPEIIADDPVSPATDLWSFGCCLYWAFTGTAPFYSDTKMLTYKNISNATYTMPEIIPKEAALLIKQLLVVKPEDRLGYDRFNNNYLEIQTHPFFIGVDWETLSQKELVL